MTTYNFTNNIVNKTVIQGISIQITLSKNIRTVPNNSVYFYNQSTRKTTYINNTTVNNRVLTIPTNDLTHSNTYDIVLKNTIIYTDGQTLGTSTYVLRRIVISKPFTPVSPTVILADEVPSITSDSIIESKGNIVKQSDRIVTITYDATISSIISPSDISIQQYNEYVNKETNAITSTVTVSNSTVTITFASDLLSNKLYMFTVKERTHDIDKVFVISTLTAIDITKSDIMIYSSSIISDIDDTGIYNMKMAIIASHFIVKWRITNFNSVNTTIAKSLFQKYIIYTFIKDVMVDGDFYGNSIISERFGVNMSVGYKYSKIDNIMYNIQESQTDLLTYLSSTDIVNSTITTSV